MVSWSSVAVVVVVVVAVEPRLLDISGEGGCMYVTRGAAGRGSGKVRVFG